MYQSYYIAYSAKVLINFSSCTCIQMFTCKCMYLVKAMMDVILVIDFWTNSEWLYDYCLFIQQLSFIKDSFSVRFLLTLITCIYILSSNISMCFLPLIKTEFLCLLLIHFCSNFVPTRYDWLLQIMQNSWKRCMHMFEWSCGLETLVCNDNWWLIRTLL